MSPAERSDADERGQASSTVSEAARRRGRPGYDRDRLLEAAVRVFNERGYDGTTMEDLAAGLEVGKSAVYHHVRGKEELLALAVDRALDALTRVLDEPLARRGGALTRLRYVVQRSVEVLIAELPYVTLLLRIRGNTDVERAALARRRGFDAVVSALVAEARTNGELRPDVDPALVARLVFGMVNSVSEWYRPHPDGDPRIVADAIATIVFDGLRA